MLFFFPRDYQDLTDRREIADLEEGQAAERSCGTVEDVELRNTGPGRCVLGVLVRGAERLPARRLVQPALHARAVRARASG